MDSLEVRVYSLGILLKIGLKFRLRTEKNPISIIIYNIIWINISIITEYL